MSNKFNLQHAETSVSCWSSVGVMTMCSGVHLPPQAVCFQKPEPLGVSEMLPRGQAEHQPPHFCLACYQFKCCVFRLGWREQAGRAAQGSDGGTGQPGLQHQQTTKGLLLPPLLLCSALVARSTWVLGLPRCCLAW